MVLQQVKLILTTLRLLRLILRLSGPRCTADLWQFRSRIVGRDHNGQTRWQVCAKHWEKDMHSDTKPYETHSLKIILRSFETWFLENILICKVCSVDLLCMPAVGGFQPIITLRPRTPKIGFEPLKLSLRVPNGAENDLIARLPHDLVCWRCATWCAWNVTSHLISLNSGDHMQKCHKKSVNIYRSSTLRHKFSNTCRGRKLYTRPLKSSQSSIALRQLVKHVCVQLVSWSCAFVELAHDHNAIWCTMQGNLS